jgi:hypothetical protein
MTHEQAGSQRNWRATLRLAVSMGDEIGVASVFSALVWEDAQQIAQRAQAFLDEFAPFYFAEEGPGTATLEHRLRMDLFRESVLAYLEGKEADVEQAIEHDIDTWIEANAPAMASANLSLMERELGEPGAQTHRDVVKLHQLVELETYERIQQRALERLWADIEATLAELLAAAER